MIYLMTDAQDILVQDGRIFSASDPDFTFAVNTNALVADSQGEIFMWVDRFPIYPDPDAAVGTTSFSQFSPFSPVGFGEAGALIGVLKDVDAFLALQAEDPSFLPGWAAFEVTQTGLVPYDPEGDIAITGLWPGAIPPEGDLAGARIAVIGEGRLDELVEAAGGVPVPFTSSNRFLFEEEMRAGTIAGGITAFPLGVDRWDRGEFGYDLFTARLDAGGFTDAKAVGPLPIAERGLTPESPPDTTPDPSPSPTPQPTPDPAPEPTPDPGEEPQPDPGSGGSGNAYVLVIASNLGVISATELDGATIALEPGTAQEQALADYFRATNQVYEPIPATNPSAIADAVRSGAADVGLIREQTAIDLGLTAPDFIVVSDFATDGTSSGDGGIQGSAQPDQIDGTEAAETLSGLGGNDTLTGGPGNDTVDGGAGTDTAVYTGGKAAHTVTISTSGITVTDRRPDGDGTDQLVSIERLTFADEDWRLDIFDDVAGLSEQAFRDFIEVYIAYFNRAPDAEGLFFYGTAFANGTSVEDSAATFLNSAEYQATYPPGQSNQEFAEAVYGNVLGRIPDLLGLNFWVGVLDSGAVSRDAFILEVLKGAKAPAPEDATQDFIDQKAADVAYLSNKTDIGLYFAVTKGMSDVPNATAAMQLFDDGDPNDIDAAVAAIDGFYADALDPVNGEFLLQLVGVVDDPFMA